MKKNLKHIGLLSILPMLTVMIGMSNIDDVFAYKQSGILEETKDTFFFRGDLSTPEGEKPYGGDKIGDFFIQVNSDEVMVIANIDSNFIKRGTLEGWLVDFGGNQNIYLGSFNEDLKLTKTIQIKEWTYEAIIITEKLDNDESKLAIIAGALLEKDVNYKSSKSF